MEGRKARIELRSVLFVYLDDLHGPTVACQEPEAFVSQASFSKYHSMLIPKSEMTQRVCWLFPSGGTTLLLFFPEELKAEHYDRYSFRYTLVLAFSTLEPYAYIRPDLVEDELSQYSVALANLASELRTVEQRHAYLLNAVHWWRTMRNTTVDGAASEGKASPAPTSTFLLGTKAWVSLEAAFSMVHSCMVGKSKVVNLGPTFAFHLEPVPLIIRVPAVDPHWCPHRAASVSDEFTHTGDIVLVDVFDRIDGMRSVFDIAHALSAEVPTVQEAVEHLMASGYVRLLPPYSFSACFVTTKAFAADLAEQSRRGGQWLEGKQLSAPITNSAALLQMVADDEADEDVAAHRPPLTFTRRDFVQYIAWRERQLGRPFGGKASSTSLSREETVAATSAALVRFVSCFTYTPVCDVQRTMQQGPFGTFFGGWCDDAVRAAVDFATLVDWLAKVGDVALGSGHKSLPSSPPPRQYPSPISLET